mgnify:CR=1 FL=1
MTRWLWLLLILLTGCDQRSQDAMVYRFNPTLAMANTVDPILSKVIQETCGPFGQGEWVRSGTIISKRERAESHYENSSLKSACIDQPGNVYYARCYEWRMINISPYQREYRIVNDVPLGVYSCIDPAHLDFPYQLTWIAKRQVGETWRETWDE